MIIYKIKETTTFITTIILIRMLLMKNFSLNLINEIPEPTCKVKRTVLPIKSGKEKPNG